MSERRAQLLGSLASTLADYRMGEVGPRTPELIDRWVDQFPSATQEPLLTALDRVVQRTYISKARLRTFLAFLASTQKLCPGEEPAGYWRRVNFLDIQQAGSSQSELLTTFGELLYETHGYPLTATGSSGGDYVYLDDCVGTGNRVRLDLCRWIAKDAPKNAKVHVITPILYRGSWWIDGRIQQAASAHAKTVELRKWSLTDFRLENRKAHRDSSDVLWPAALPDHPDVQAYVEHLRDSGHPPVLRTAGSRGTSAVFDDEAQRALLEEALLVRGCEIRRECDNLPEHARPLGYHNLDCLGFGSLLVTYRNCPNNCPLAFWADQIDYPPLFPRKTNTQTAGDRLLQSLGFK